MNRKEKRHQISEWFIFSWIPEKNTLRTLTAFGIFSAVIHFIGFYLFQVVYPEPVRSELRPDRLLLLDTGSPEVRTFLERIQDRNIYLEPPSANSESRVRLSDYAVRFVPSFAETDPVPKRLERHGDVLRSEIPEPASSLEVENWRNRVIFSDSLIRRGIAPQSIFDDYLDFVPNLPPLRVNLSVASDGRPVHVAVLGEISSEDGEILAEAIRETLRFQPAPGDGVPDPGWMELGRSASEP